MIKTILNFGDSWAHAADTGRENGYATIISKELGMNLQDYSIPSTGNPRMILQFQTFLEEAYQPNNQYIALFFVSAVERLIFFDEKQPYDLWPDSFEDFYTRWYSDSYGEFVTNSSLIVLQHMCRSRGIRDVYILGWQTPILWPDVDQSRFLFEGRTSIAQKFGGKGLTPLYDLINRVNSIYLIPNNGHPSVAGHRFIADSVLHHLKLDQ